MKVKDIMVEDVKTCTPKATLDEIALTMLNAGCGSVAVVDSKKQPQGIVTDRDIALTAARMHKPLWEISCQELTQNQKVFTIGSDDDIDTALKLFQDQHIRRLPVVDSKGRLAGILSVDDLISNSESRLSLHPFSISYTDTMKTLKAVVRSH